MTRVAVVGDVHGHLREMVLMLRALEDYGVDRIIMLGDLCDRGPDSVEALRYGMTECFIDRKGALAPLEVVRGNHEDGYVRAWRRVPKPGRNTLSKPEEDGTFKKLSPELLGWMERLPIYIRVPELRLVCLHGGVTPHHQSLDHYSEHILRCRYLDEKTHQMKGGLLGDLFWADVYDGRFGTIVFGHESHQRPTRYEHAVAVDGEGYRRVHSVVFDTEDDYRAAFTCPYGGHVFEDALSQHPVRYYSFGKRHTPKGGLRW